jgi:hypothetical protein
MADLYHYWSGDLQVSATGDLLMADQTTTGQQTVLRRLLTNALLSDVSGNPLASPDYTFHPPYGAGLPYKVGSPVSIPSVIAIIRAQMALEPSVARKPLPTIQVTTINNGLSVFIQYNDAQTQTPVTLSFDVTR